jgi:HNH endonuclease
MVAIRKNIHLTVEQLKELLNYNPETGLWTWIKARGRCAKGSFAGTMLDGYIMIYVDKVGYLAHRLAWFYMTNRWPLEVDHKNTIKNDNRWDNLREATRSQNKFNVPALSNNTCGFKGVFYQKLQLLRMVFAVAIALGMKSQ